jgi:hypothetical protein
MKPAQWTAILALALMVGGITFVAVYLGSSSGPSDVVPEEPRSLTFPIKAFPIKANENEKVSANEKEKPSGPPPLVTEVRQYGHQDYWFLNESEQDLDVGLSAKGCTCSSVEIALVPQSWWRPYADQWAATQVLAAVQLSQLPLRWWEGLAMMKVLNAPDRKFPELPEKDLNHIFLNKDNKFTAPAGSIGRVRLGWWRQTSGEFNAHATMWTGPAGGPYGGNTHARLDARVVVAEPVVLIGKHVTLPAATTRELAYPEKSKTGIQAWIMCGSVTRYHFQVHAELIHEHIKAESDPVEIGEPIPLDADDIRKLAKDFGEQMPTILSGYKVPVTLKARAKDGTPVEWGHYHRSVRMTAEDSSEPVTVVVKGEVLGDVTVGEVGKVRGSLDLGPFPRKRGKEGRVMLQTDEKNLDLELDTSRLPEYVKATLSKPRESTGGHRSWELRVEIPANAAWGEFPRDNSPVYRDSAVYVKTKEKPPRSIRVPVIGTANDG